MSTGPITSRQRKQGLGPLLAPRGEFVPGMGARGSAPWGEEMRCWAGLRWAAYRQHWHVGPRRRGPDGWISIRDSMKDVGEGTESVSLWNRQQDIQGQHGQRGGGQHRGRQYRTEPQGRDLETGMEHSGSRIADGDPTVSARVQRDWEWPTPATQPESLQTDASRFRKDRREREDTRRADNNRKEAGLAG